MGFVEYTGLKNLNRIYEWGKPTYEILGKKRSIIDMALTNNIRQIKKYEVKPQILGVNAQTAHKIIQITLDADEVGTKCVKEKLKKLRHCSREALMRVRGEVAKNLKILKILRGKKTPHIYKYGNLRRIYQNAKVKYIGYRKEGRNITPMPAAIRKIQAAINQTVAQITREKRPEKIGERKPKEMEVLIHRYKILEKELYELWEAEKKQSWVQWIKKLNTLDHSKATREFYSEIKKKNHEKENVGPIVNGVGKLSTTLEEKLENWRKYYKKLYSKQKVFEEEEQKEESCWTIRQSIVRKEKKS